MPTPDSTPERDSLIQMLREEVVLEYTARYSEHRDLDVEATADNILASDWLAAHDRDVATKALVDAANLLVRPDYRISMVTGVDPSGTVAVNEALHRAADRLHKHAANLREETPRA
jgi:hypothetical protein